MSYKDVKGLGKGLGAILGEEVPSVDQLRKPVGYINKAVAGSSAQQDTAGVLRVPVDAIDPNPFQPRMSFDQAALDELASSIRNLGLIQPITVRRIGDNRYQIISGERRFKACRLCGMTTIPAYVRESNDQGMLEMAIVENVQRENLDPIELALSYQRLIEECRFTQDQMAERLGKNRATVANTLRLLKLPAKVQHDLKVGLISPGHAKAILGVDDPSVQEQLCDLVLSDALSVRQLEQIVRKIQLTGSGVPKKKAAAKDIPLPEEYNRLIGCVGRYFGENVSVRRSSAGKGTMTIKFSSDAEVARFLEALEQLN